MRLQIIRRFGMPFAFALLLAIICAFGMPLGEGGTKDAFAEPADEAVGSTDDTEAGDDTKAETIAVADIELSDYESEMTVGKTQELSATVLPFDATEQTITFSSNNTAAVTVSSKGQVKAVGKGVAIIRMQAGGVVREVSIEVRVATTAIETPLSFVVLTPGETFVLKASVVPNDAPQSLTYTSTNNDVVEVTAQGTVGARRAGTSSIIISNGDASAAVTILVNERIVKSADGADGEASPIVSEEQASGISVAESALIGEFGSGEGTVRVRQSDWPTITKPVLKVLYATDSTLIVEAPSYTMTIRGEKIENEQNVLSTDIRFAREEGYVDFVLNGRENLPGEIELELTDQNLNKEYLYLWNFDKGEYQKLASKSDTVLTLDEAGEYRLTDEPIDTLGINVLWMQFGIPVIGLGLVAFIIIRRRFWFW
ncbi:MAG: Ig-like domain-containing protein [Coriobacteriales bacterium]|nr:Ig-like domain-containing protein [Coriobacteriales bacterium]